MKDKANKEKANIVDVIFIVISIFIAYEVLLGVLFIGLEPEDRPYVDHCHYENGPSDSIDQSKFPLVDGF